MPRLSKEKREEVTELLKNGCSLRSIAKKMNTTPSTIHRLMKRYEATGSVDDRPKSGRPRIMPASESSWFECVGVDRPFVCTECGKTFEKMTGLKKHLKIHGEREYQCDRCGRDFVSADALNRHRRCHTGEKPFICEYCARGFAHMGTMRTHIRTHTGERPYKCHLCDHACATAGNLHAHMKVHRDEKGCIPRPINVKLPIAKKVPIFSRKDILKSAKRKYEKYNGESWPDGDDSSGKDSEPSLKEEEADAVPYKTMNVLQHERDMFTYKTSKTGNHHEQSSAEDDSDSSQSSYKVLVKQETDADVSERVGQLLSSETVGASLGDEPCAQEGKSCTQETESCMQEDVPCTQEEVPWTQEEESCMPGDVPCTQEEESCMPGDVPCTQEEESCRQEYKLCTHKEESYMKEEEACTPEDEPRTQVDKPCKQEEQTCTQEDEPRTQVDKPCKQEEQTCTQEEESCSWEEEYCTQEEELSKQEKHPCTPEKESCISGEPLTCISSEEDIKKEPRMSSELIRITCRLSKAEREEAIELLENGCSLRSIAKKMKTSPSTIHRLMKRHETTGSVDDRPRSGRPRIMPASEWSWFECVGVDRPFVCTECGKTFEKMTGLKKHLKIHGQREYQCDQCGRSFVSSATFVRHQRCHTGERPYICEYCAKGFADMGTMRTHIRTHTGERPYKCHLCDYACGTAGNLHAHMKVHKDETGCIPRPINVKLPLAKRVPIFSRKDILKNTKRKYEKYSGEYWPDGDDFSGKDSEPSLKEEEEDSEPSLKEEDSEPSLKEEEKDSEPSLKEEAASYKTMNVLQQDKDILSPNTSETGNCHEQCLEEDGHGF